MSPKKINEKISTFLLRIPNSSEKAASISSLTGKINKEIIDPVVLFLKFFGSIRTRSSKAGEITIKSKTKISDLFHKSLARYIKTQKSIISNWEKLGVDQNQNLIFNWGVDFLYQMESKRLLRHKDKKQIRTIIVSQVLIKAKVKGEKEPQFLMQFDNKAQKYQFVGGRKDPEDETAKDTMKRELSEELHLNKFILDQNYKLRSIAQDIEYFQVSPTFGALTKYNFNLYEIEFDDYDLVLEPGDRWVSIEEIRDGYTLDNKVIQSEDLDTTWTKIALRLPPVSVMLPLMRS